MSDNPDNNNQLVDKLVSVLKDAHSTNAELNGSLVAQAEKADKRKFIFRMIGLSYLVLSFFVVFWMVNNGPADNPQTEPHVAVVDIIGPIARDSGVSAYKTMEALQKAFENEHSKVIALNADSPGGSPAQSNLIYQEILRLKEEYPAKKVYAVVGDICASGCMYIISAADEILADPTSIVGSIGVKMDSFGFTGLMGKLGVERRSVSAGEFKHIFDPYFELDPDAVSHLQEWLVTNTHKVFINAVQQGRGDKLADDDSLYTGLVWTGDKAIELGLVDGYGDLHKLAREHTEDSHIHNYTKRVPNFMSMLSSSIATGIKDVVMNLEAEYSYPRMR